METMVAKRAPTLLLLTGLVLLCELHHSLCGLPPRLRRQEEMEQGNSPLYEVDLPPGDAWREVQLDARSRDDIPFKRLDKRRFGCIGMRNCGRRCYQNTRTGETRCS